MSSTTVELDKQFTSEAGESYRHDPRYCVVVLEAQDEEDKAEGRNRRARSRGR